MGYKQPTQQAIGNTGAVGTVRQPRGAPDTGVVGGTYVAMTATVNTDGTIHSASSAFVGTTLLTVASSAPVATATNQLWVDTH